MNRWRVFRESATRMWIVWPPEPMDREWWFPTWREAYAYARARATA